MSAGYTPEWMLPDGVRVTGPEDVQECLAGGGPDPWIPVGTGTSLARGGTPVRPARALDLSALNKVLAHVHEDLTVTVEAGATLETVQSCLSERGQWLPVDPFPAAKGTVGGMIAADRRGPLAGGLGTLRDYLIGVGFVDGRARHVSSGGRVVKNVAGYDLMRLLTGSLGELGVVVEATFKVLPRPETWAGVVLPNPDAAQCETALHSSTWTWFPVGFWRGDLGEGEHLLAVFAGPRDRVRAQVRAISDLWGSDAATLDEAETVKTLRRLQSRLHEREHTVGWGGALPSFLASESVAAAFGPDVWWADLQRGHLWWLPDDGLSAGRVDHVRSGLRSGKGHVHLDRPGNETGSWPVWGLDPGEEAAVWKRIKHTFDPEGRLVSGRLPGGV